jgi:hypothetical protein
MEVFVIIACAVLTAIVTIFIFALRGIDKRIDDLNDRFTYHEASQAKVLETHESEIATFRNNYLERFAEIHKSINSMKEVILERVNAVQIDITKLQTTQEKNNRESKR